MSTKTTITLAAALIAATSSLAMTSAFAGDQDLVTELQDSGRYFGIGYTANPQHLSGAYASARSARIGAYDAPLPQHDFQLEGR